MQIVIHPQAKKALIVILAVAILGIGFLAVRPALVSRPATTTAGLSADARAAVNAVTTFYTLDYSEDIDLWAAHLCATATEARCRVIQDYFAPTVQAMVQKNQVQSGCIVEPIRLVVDKNHSRIWQVHVSLDHSWPGLDTPAQDVYVEIAEVDGKWLLNRILCEQEVERLVTPTP